MDLFGTKTRKLQEKIDNMENNLRLSFDRVKDENENTHAWLNYYYQRNYYLEDQLNRLNDLSQTTKNMTEDNSSVLDSHKRILDELAENEHRLLQKITELQSLNTQQLPKNEFNYHIENISREIRRIETKIESLTYLDSKMNAMKRELAAHLDEPHVSDEIEEKVEDLQKKLKSIIVKKTPRQRLVQKVNKNTHDYIKAMVLSYIKKYEKISGFQLREMIVEEQNLTSKSTLYRILDEIETMDEISTIREGKQKIFLSKLKKSA